MTLNQFLDRYIAGYPGFYYFDIPVGRKNIGGGYFSRKANARSALLHKLVELLDGENKIEPLCIQRGNPQETNAHADSGDQSLAASISTNTD